ncbi:aldehyde dehydrogenase family protein [Ereboglobus luteus]|uniref:aldehyde dehydrogenase (NAD(+)) n=1 Tax=Ereboglobus luteus TaxID=1796921 RepID=A0A2U8E4M6_9BACT|nr:aldehyde dehydrogenase family protein [Ereboglobus luteus]AWI09801.1 aldehyde dehydrogenase family protein [Ereboglobus luteus]
MKHITQHYINGHFVESRGTETIDLINPANKRVIGRVLLGNEEDARDAVRAAKKSFEAFSRTSVSERAEMLQRLHDAVLAREADHVAARTEEYGGVPLHNKFSIRGAAKVFLNMKKTLENYSFSKRLGPSVVTMKPIGVAGLITPWNSAIFMVCNKLAPAIAAGCATVVKPSELSTIQTRILAECVHDAGLPAGVINMVNGRGNVVGTELTRNPDVAKISFTGSTSTGKTVMCEAAATIKRVTLELGGKSPHIVLDDADADKAAVFALEAVFRNNGQACIAGSRLLIPAHRLEEMKAALLRALPAWKVGNPNQADTVIGPLVNEIQYNRVQEYIRKGITEGAKLLAGGEGHPNGLDAGWFAKPTIFTNVNNDMTIAREEIFGPVLCVITYKTEDDAVRIANDTIYGLQGWISTSNSEHGREIAGRIEAGAVMVNESFDLLDEAGIPAGGVKQSGVGREFGIYGLEEYLEPQAVFAR